MMHYKLLNPTMGSIILLLVLVSFTGAHRMSRGYATVTGNDEAKVKITPSEPEELEKVMEELRATKAISKIENTHPLDPLSAMEMRLIGTIVKLYNTSSAWQFKCIGLHEPDKQLVYPYFQSATSPPAGLIPRRAQVLIADPVTRAPVWVIVNLSSLRVEKWEDAKPGEKVAVITNEDTALAIDIVFSNPAVLARISALGYDVSQVIADVWEAGYVADNPTYAQAMKLVQIFFYGLNGPNDNNYFAHPFDFVVYVELGADVVRGIENLPIQQGFSTSDRKGNSVPKTNVNFLPNLLPPNSFRRDLNPIKISQPRGPSFRIHGREVSWSNFKFRVGYNPREGAHIYTVTYNDNGQIRPLIYRLSFSEVYLSYGDPRPPYQRKSSFDLGNFEFGTSTVQLPVHQFCRGDAYYFEADHHNEHAGTWITQNSICVVEEDAGLEWAYYDSIDGQVAATRAQRLTVSFFVAIGNTNYWLSYRFYTDATIEVAVKVTGVLSTNLMAVDVKAPPYGNLLTPQVYSEIYQHFFAIRVDADIDGLDNTVTVEDIVPVSATNSPANPYGNGLTTQATVLKTPGEARTNIRPARYWRISNPNVAQPLSGKPTSWKLIPQGSTYVNAPTPDSPIWSRIPWANHSTWVLPYNPDQIFAGGDYLDCGVSKWTNENPTANIVDSDVVLWYVFSYTHTPDIEDWPVLSSCPGNIGFRLRPSNFLNANPAITVPPASETTALDGSGSQGGWSTS